MADILASLTPGERLLLWRRRAGYSQSEMAREHGLTRSRYSKIERDEVETTIGVTLGGLSKAEEMFIHRRREGLTQKEVASEIGMSRYWISRMETGSVACEPLVRLFDDNAKLR